MTPARATSDTLFPHLPATTRTAAMAAVRYLLLSASILLLTLIGSVFLTSSSPRNLARPLIISLSVGGGVSLAGAVLIHCRTQPTLPVVRALHRRAEQSPTLLLTTLLLLLTGPALILPVHPHVYTAAVIALTLGAPGLLTITTLTWLRVTCGYQRSRPRPSTRT